MSTRHYTKRRGRDARLLTPALIALTLATAPIAAAKPTDPPIVPAGTLVPIRFLTPVASGRTPRGWTVEAQTMADLNAGTCVVVPAYTHLLGIVDESRAGRLFRRRGRLHLTFEAVGVGPGLWAPLSAVLQGVEWLAPDLTDTTGLVRAPEGSLGHALIHGSAPGLALAVVTDDIAAPVGLVATAVGLVRRGPKVEIRAGDEATVRLTAPFVRPTGPRCGSAKARVAPASDMDGLPARTEGGNGQVGDVINLVIRGTEEELREAFERADWVEAAAGGLRPRIGAAGAVILGKSYTHAPVSTQRLFGRVEDLAFERQGASARTRHHVRIWAADQSRTLWLGAASEDIGIHVTVVKPRLTHRIAPQIDLERDLLTRELEAGGCARRQGYVRLAGAPSGGRNSSGEEFTTDGQAAQVRVETCGGL